METNPTVKTVTETQALLQVVGGGDKEVNKLLEKIREAQEHNDIVLGAARSARQDAEDARAETEGKMAELKRAQEIFQAEKEEFNNVALAEISRAQNEFQAEKDKFYSGVKSSYLSLNKRKEEADICETKLKSEQAEFSTKKKKDQLAIKKAEDDIQCRNVALGKQETSCRERGKILDDIHDRFTSEAESLSKLSLYAKSIL